MAIVFAVRGNSTDARFSGGYPQGSRYNSSVVGITPSANALSGSFIDLTTTASVKALVFDGFKNTSNNRASSMLLRFAPGYTGAPAARRMLWSLSAGAGVSTAYLEIFHEPTTGNILVIGKNETGAATFGTINLGAWTSGVAGTPVDFLWTWDGTNTANAGKLYINGTLLGAGATSTNSLSASWDNTMWRALVLGCGANGTVSSLSVDEFIIWDSVISPTGVQLTSGSGTLNGSTRTALVEVSAYDGSTASSSSNADITTIKNDVKFIKNGLIGSGGF